MVRLVCTFPPSITMGLTLTLELLGMESFEWVAPRAAGRSRGEEEHHLGAELQEDEAAAMVIRMEQKKKKKKKKKKKEEEDGYGFVSLPYKISKLQGSSSSSSSVLLLIQLYFGAISTQHSKVRFHTLGASMRPKTPFSSSFSSSPSSPPLPCFGLTKTQKPNASPHRITLIVCQDTHPQLSPSSGVNATTFFMP